MKASSLFLSKLHRWQHSLQCNSNLLPTCSYHQHHHHRHHHHHHHSQRLNRINNIDIGKKRGRFLSTSKEILSTLSVKELRKLITDNGLNDKGCIDKDSLVERAAEALMIQNDKSKESAGPNTIRKEDDSVPSSPVASPVASASASVSETQEQKDEEMKRKLLQLFMTDKEFHSLPMESLTMMTKSPSLETLKASLQANPELAKKTQNMLTKILAITGDMNTFVRISQKLMQNPFNM